MRAIVDHFASLHGESDVAMPLAISHGDLQTGNVWVEKDGRVWVYDWETQGRRSVWYDRATLLYATRRAGGLEKLLSAEDLSDLCDQPCQPATTELIRHTVLLEEMLFYLDDMLELPDKDGAAIFERFTDRIDERMIRSC